MTVPEPSSAHARRRRSRPVDCDVHAIQRPDCSTVNSLARLALAARRDGRSLRLLGARDELRALIDLAGLGAVLVCDGLPLEAGRQPEQRKEPRRVEEKRDPGDPVA